MTLSLEQNAIGMVTFCFIVDLPNKYSPCLAFKMKDEVEKKIVQYACGFDRGRCYSL